MDLPGAITRSRTVVQSRIDAEYLKLLIVGSTVKILVLQHIVSEHPGVFRDFLVEDGLSRDTIELDEGQAIPDLEPYDLMIVMGGPQDVWEEDRYPWLRTEKEAFGGSF